MLCALGLSSSRGTGADLKGRSFTAQGAWNKPLGGNLPTWGPAPSQLLCDSKALCPHHCLPPSAELALGTAVALAMGGLCHEW